MPWPYPEHNPFHNEDHPLDEDLRLAALVAQRLRIDWTPVGWEKIGETAADSGDDAR